MGTFYTQPLKDNPSFSIKDFLLHCSKAFLGIDALQKHIDFCKKDIENEKILLEKDDNYWIQNRITVLEDGNKERGENIIFTKRYHKIWDLVKSWQTKENFAIQVKQFALEQLTVSNFNFSYPNDILKQPISEAEWIVRSKQRCLNNIEERNKTIKELEDLLKQQLAKLEELNKDLVNI